jgi:hypothetical protein
MRVMSAYTERRCPEDYITDAPLRALRKADGQIWALAADGHNWFLTGTSLLSLSTTCAPAMQSGMSDEELAHDYESWIQATYSKDGTNVFGLVSEALEGHGGSYPCYTKAESQNCWINTITAAFSRDGGSRFILYPVGKRVVAESNRKYDPSQHGLIGYLTTSNIVSNGSSYFVFIYVNADPSGGQAKGNCLFESKSLFDTQSWFAWSGNGFNAVTRKEGRREAQPCTPLAPSLLDQPVRSLTYWSKYKVWVATFFSRRATPSVGRVPGIFMSTSRDLLNWSDPTLVMQAHQQREPGECNDFIRYPSILDPDSASRNFDTIDSGREILTFTYNFVTGCHGSYNRDLEYVALREQAP